MALLLAAGAPTTSPRPAPRPGRDSHPAQRAEQAGLGAL